MKKAIASDWARVGESERERKIRWKKKISVERFLIITSVSIPYSLESHPCFDFLGIRCVFPVISIVVRALTIRHTFAISNHIAISIGNRA